MLQRVWIRCGRNYQPWGHLRLLKGCQGVGALWLEAWPGQLGMDWSRSSSSSYSSSLQQPCMASTLLEMTGPFRNRINDVHWTRRQTAKHSRLHWGAAAVVVVGGEESELGRDMEPSTAFHMVTLTDLLLIRVTRQYASLRFAATSIASMSIKLGYGYVTPIIISK